MTTSPNDDAAIYVGPARVLSVAADGRPRVLALGGAWETIVADWAIPFRYAPRSGDLLLVIGRAGRYWVTGVVHGRGRSTLAFRGATTLSAAGTLRLGGDGGMRLDGPEIRLEAGEVNSEIGTAVQRVDESDTTVPGELDERAGECSQVIDGNDERTAARHETVAARVVRIDGQLLRLS